MQQYNFDVTVTEDDSDYEDNAERGRIWHSTFEEAGWNIHLTGYAAQLSIQPKVDEMNLSADELSEFFADADIRSGEYVKNSVALSKVKAPIGNTSIEQINPYTLPEYLRRGLAFVDTHQGAVECKKFYGQIKTGFGPVMSDALTLSE